MPAFGGRKTPGRVGQIRVSKHLVACQVFSLFRLAVGRQVGRASTHDFANVCQPPGDERRVRELRDSHGKVKSLFNQIYVSVVEVQMNA